MINSMVFSHRRSAGAQQVQARTSKSHPTIMVVDDDSDIRAMLTDLLEDEGYRVITAGNGQEALRTLRTGDVRPSLILLDLMMPVMNGWQFRTEQRKDSVLSSIPVVVITAHGGMPGQPELGETAGYLKKPIPLDTLLNLAERFAGPP